MGIRIGIVVLVALAAAASHAWDGPAAASDPGTLAGGAIHNCLLTGEGAVQCWGDGRFGQLGSRSPQGCAAAHIPCSRVPVDVEGLSGVVDLAAGADHNCALTDADEVWCWGANGSGQLGPETGETCTFDQPCSVEPVRMPGLSDTIALAAGGSHTCALDGSGIASCWGANDFGQLGDGTRVSRSEPDAVLGDVRFVAIAAGGQHTCGLEEAGVVWCWGSDFLGQLGAETTELCGNAGNIACSSIPLEIAALEGGVAAIAAGATHTCAIADANGPSCWGENSFGQLGDGTTVHRAAPVSVPGLAGGVLAIAAGAASRHTCAVTAQGGAMCWGDNGFGQLGAASSDGCGLGDGLPCSTTPLEVSGLDQGVSAIAPGGDQSCAIAEGAVMCWGRNDRGQLAAHSSESCALGISCSTTPVAATGFDPKVTPTPCPAGGCPTPTASPTATPSPMSSPTVRPSILGDVDCDGAITAVDAALVLQLEAGLIGSTLLCADAGDVDRDGAIGAIDAALLLQFTAGLLPALP